MPKSNGEVPRNQKFIPYNYRIEREQWAEEMFYRDLEFENPDLINIPYYNAMRTSARERFDTAERLPRIDIASAMRFRGAQEITMSKPKRTHPDHTQLNYLSYLLKPTNIILDRSLLSHAGHGWKPYHDGIYRYNIDNSDSTRLALEIITCTSHYTREKVNRIVLRYSPLIVATFSDPYGPYDIEDKTTGEKFSALPVPLVKDGDDQFPPPMPVSVRGHFRVTFNHVDKRSGKKVPMETDVSINYKKREMLAEARERLLEFAYEELKRQNIAKRVELSDIQVVADVYNVTLKDLMKLIKEKKAQSDREEYEKSVAKENSETITDPKDEVTVKIRKPPRNHKRSKTKRSQKEPKKQKDKKKGKRHKKNLEDVINDDSDEEGMGIVNNGTEASMVSEPISDTVPNENDSGNGHLELSRQARKALKRETKAKRKYGKFILPFHRKRRGD